MKNDLQLQLVQVEDSKDKKWKELINSYCLLNTKIDLLLFKIRNRKKEGA